jgi:hypothetical protein
MMDPKSDFRNQTRSQTDSHSHAILCTYCVIVLIACAAFVATVGFLTWFAIEAFKTNPKSLNEIGFVTVLSVSAAGCTCSGIAYYALEALKNIFTKTE